MKKNISKIVCILASLLLVFTLVGCGSNTSKQNEEAQKMLKEAVDAAFNEAEQNGLESSTVTLETISAHDKIKQLIKKDTETILEMYPDIYTAIETEFSGNNVEYRYYYVQGYEIDVEQLKEADWDEIVKETSDSFEQGWRVRPESITYKHYDYQGNMVYSNN
ncbi:MAG: hypothetical protein MJ133_00565 [Lachnospiraceae bacterium]|nr:hypothetical protein [Lachnospiraceae bacterium]